MTKIVLDAESFKALASDTRLLILKALDARPLTVSELGRLLNLNKATVFEHLKQLLSAELAKREEDPARKWVYYKLTWKGKNVLHPENAQIFLLLGVAAFGVGGALFQSAQLLRLALESGKSPLQQGEFGTPSPSHNALSADQADHAPAANAPASGASATSPTTTSMAKTGQSPVAPQPSSQSPHHWSDIFQSNTFYIAFGLVVLVGLVLLIAWALRSDQRNERRQILGLLETLPADVNRAEESSV